MSIAFGLDFGTTNSALSINKDGKVAVVDIDALNVSGKTLRSVLYFDENQNIFSGQEAIHQYIKTSARGRFMQSMKEFLPDDCFRSTNIYGKAFTLVDLIAIVLKKIKDEGEKYIGDTVDTVVIGRPVFFSEDSDDDKLAEDRLKKAAQKVGFENISFQMEPIAAALTFEQSLEDTEEKFVLVGDFGGGTSDFTIMKLKGGVFETGVDRKKDILSLGMVHLGGDSFDSCVMSSKIAKYFGKDIKYKDTFGQYTLDMPASVMNILGRWHLIPQLRERKMRESIRQIKMNADNRQLVENLESIIDDNYSFMLFQAIERAKCELSSYNSSQIVFDEKSLSIREELARSEFESMIKESIERIKKCIDSLLVNACLSAKDIDVVFTTGGSSYIPCVKQIFIDKFGEEKIKHADAFTSVAYGLGVSSSLF